MSESRLEMLKKMLSDDPEDSFVLYAIAKEYQNMGLLRESASQLTDLKKKDPDYVGLYYHLGKIYESLEETVNAIKAYQDGILVAKKLKDFHALSELSNALTDLESGY